MLYNDYISQFESMDLLMRGGQKRVYKVLMGSEFYAFKIIYDCDDSRVLQEIDILKKIDITGVPKIKDFGILQGTNGENILFILEDFICDDSLRKRIKNGECFNLVEAYNLIRSLLLIEIELEKLGIIHRDIKPENILINLQGEVYLIDFGVAKILGRESLTNANNTYAPHTPGYAPSEQIMNERMAINSRTDLYQIGVTVYELVSGINPFLEVANSANEVYQRTMNFTPKPLEIQGDELGHFSSFIAMLMAKQQSQRPDNATKALQYLDAIKDTLILGE